MSGCFVHVADAGWEGALKYFTDKATFKFFFPVVVYKLLTGVPVVPARLLAVMQRLPLSDLGNCVDSAIDYTITLLTRTGDQFEAYFASLTSAIINLIWKHHVFSIVDVIMSLIRSNTMDKQSSTIVIRMLDGLLFSDMAVDLKALVAHFCTEMQGTEDPYRTATWHVQHTHHLRKHSAVYGASSPFVLLGGSGRVSMLSRYVCKLSYECKLSYVGPVCVRVCGIANCVTCFPLIAMCLQAGETRVLWVDLHAPASRAGSRSLVDFGLCCRGYRSCSTPATGAVICMRSEPNGRLQHQWMQWESTGGLY